MPFAHADQRAQPAGLAEKLGQLPKQDAALAVFVRSQITEIKPALGQIGDKSQIIEVCF